MMSVLTSAVGTAVGLETGYANDYLEITSTAVLIFSSTPLGGNSGIRSICISSSGPRSHSGMWINSGVIRVLFLFLF